MGSEQHNWNKGEQSTYNNLYDIWCSISSHIVQPACAVFKCGATGDVICNNYTICTPIIALRYRAKPFLASRIPDLQLKNNTNNMQIYHCEHIFLLVNMWLQLTLPSLYALWSASNKYMTKTLKLLFMMWMFPHHSLLNNNQSYVYCAP